ncbi:MAG: hypothetical protein K0S07_357 [Chlamydiales bacterium]|jgi:hypothetical protein|nr:hypothetical protein [Chlamydiales bacterium]
MKLELKAIKSALESYDFQTALQPANDVLQDQLFISLGQDEEKRALLLQLRVYHESLAKEGEEEDPIYFLSLFLGLPFAVEESSFGDVARTILMINKAAPFSPFGLSEIDGVAYFNHLLTFKKDELEEDLLIATVSIAIHYIRTFASFIEEVALKKKSADALFAEAKLSAKSFL